LVITHEMDVIKDLCTHVAVMEGGQIIEQGRVLDVLTNPQTDTARRFFSKEYVDEDWLKNTSPDWLKNTAPQDQSSKICRAIFIDEAARRPFINDVVRRFDIELSILSGNIESVGGTMVGSLVLEISGADETVAETLKYFIDNGVKIDVLPAKEVVKHV